MSIKKNSLAMRLSLIISITILAVFLIIGPLTYSNIYTQLLAHLKIETMMKEESISRDIQNNFENARIITEQMAFNHEIIRYLKTTKNRADVTRNPLYPSVLRTLQEIKLGYTTNFLVWVANEQANFYLDSDGTIPDTDYDVKKRPWYPVAMKKIGQASYTEPYVEWGTKKVVMSNIMALQDNGKVFGFVVVDMELSKLPEIFNKFGASDTAQRYLINKRGEYVYHPDKTKVLSPKYNLKTNELQDYAAEILSGKSGFKQIRYNNTNYFLSYTPASDNGWVIVSLINKSVLTNEIMPFTLLLLLLFGTTVLFLIISVYFVSLQKMKPIAVIANYASIISKGDFSSNLPEIYLKRKDEMGTLSRAFQVIADTFRNENISLEEKIKEKNEELEQQYKHIIETEKMVALGSLVAGVAHEINTPVGVALSSASYIRKMNSENRLLLADGKMTKQDLEDFMQQLDESTELLTANLTRAAELIKSFKQIAVNQSTVSIMEFNLKETIDGIILSLRHEYKHQQHQIINNCPDDIEMCSYPGAYTQIFTNLIMNSIQHAFIDRTNGTMQFDCVQEDNNIKIIYSDNGCGMPPEVLEHIYEPFFTTQRQKGNSGLGMHIVFNIVTQKLGGTINCENKEEGGVRFTINVPAAHE